MTTTETDDYTRRVAYVEKEWGELVGKTIKTVRPLTRTEAQEFYWEYENNYEAMVIIFTDGTIVVPSADPEGNGAGFLFLGKLG
jgi:hypothetical protein